MFLSKLSLDVLTLYPRDVTAVSPLHWEARVQGTRQMHNNSRFRVLACFSFIHTILNGAASYFTQDQIFIFTPKFSLLYHFRSTQYTYRNSKLQGDTQEGRNTVIPRSLNSIYSKPLCTILCPGHTRETRQRPCPHGASILTRDRRSSRCAYIIARRKGKLARGHRGASRLVMEASGPCSM